MSAAEMVHRFKQVFASRLVTRNQVRASVTIHRQSLQPGLPVFSLPENLDVAPYILEADDILAGNLTLFTAETVKVGVTPAWNRHPQSSHGVEHGAKAGGSNGTRKPAADIKYVWEINRHLQWMRLAQASVLSGEARYHIGLAGQIRSWLEQCPPLTGPNWSSAMELAIRLINWSVVWQMLGGWDGVIFRGVDGEQLRTRWLESIHAHGQFISHNLSRHSSANNHLIGELAGLYVAARTWQFGERSSAWAVQAKAELEREVTIQHFSDGGNREQAFAYQAYTCECLTLAGVYGQRSGDPFSDEFWHALRRAYRFLRSMSDVAGNFPMVGDSDDGAVLRLAPRDGGVRAAAILALGDAMYGDGVDERPDDAVRWLLGDEKNWLRTPAGEPATGWQFPASGYYCFGAHFGQPDEIKGMVDCGALGYLGIAAHGHADALAIWLSIGGEACLVDPGTFSYGGEYRWRDYFRSTSAHNTIRIDGLDQSVSGGRFLWTRKAKASVEKIPLSPAQFDFAGSHDGYLRLRDPVRHRRSVKFDDTQKCLLVKDDVSGNATHEIEQFWHFAPHIQVQINGADAVARGSRFELQMRFSSNNLELELIRGQEDPPLGWYSRGYGTKEPATVLRVRTASSAVVIEVKIEVKFAISGFSGA